MKLDATLKKIAKAKAGRLRIELLDAAVELALDGFAAEAAQLFELGLAHEKHPHESLFLAMAANGLRVALGQGKSPAARKQAAQDDARVRGDLTMDRWDGMPRPKARKGLPPAELDTDGILEWFRRGLLSYGEPGGLAILHALLLRPDLPAYYRNEATLLVADGLARAGDHAAAVELLTAWRKKPGSFPEQALVFQALAKLIAGGALGSSSGLKPAEVAAFVKAAGGAKPKAATAASKHKIATSWNQFYLEPQTPPKGAPELSKKDFARGYRVDGGRVFFSTPTETAEVEVELRLGAAGDGELDGAEPVLRFKLPVTGDLFLRSAEDGSNDRRYAVPPGKYTATVAYRKGKPLKKAGLDRYHVDVWLTG